MSINNKCFCGSNNNYSYCCQPYINNKQTQQAFPQTPEQLMRSRFSAYASGNSQYIYDTYAKSSQASQSVEDINDWSKACVWIALEIHSTNNGDNTLNDSPEQFVEFSAFYITEDTLFELRENSRFVLEGSMKDNAENNTENNAEANSQNFQWRYIDGDIIKHCQLATIKRKELCPCNNYPTTWLIKKGKKFKQCCGKLCFDK
tara:strand:- start:6176 stop:6784 length:609 start_codon:yes stop_codon:yes gene_type:complete